MSLLDRKLLRDIAAMRGQVITIALVVAAGVAVFVASVSTYDSLQSGRDRFYADARFPQVFVTLKRAPLSIVAQLNEISGVAAVEPRIVRDVIVDWPSSMLPVSARMVSLAHAGDEPLARLHLRRGTAPEPGDTRGAAINEAFAEANGGDAGPGRSRRAQRPGAELPHHRHRASPEYVYAVKPGLPIPDDRLFAVLWIDRSAAEAAFDMKGAFNDAVVSLAPGADPKPVIAELDRLLEPYGSVGAVERRDQPSNRFLEDELNQQKVMSTTIPFIFFGVAAFLLNVALGRLVAAQREQIAALKALGFPDRAARAALSQARRGHRAARVGARSRGRIWLRARDDCELSRLLPPAGPRIRAYAMVGRCRHRDQPCGRFARRPDRAAERHQSGPGGRHAPGGTAALSSFLDRGPPASQSDEPALDHDAS